MSILLPCVNKQMPMLGMPIKLSKFTTNWPQLSVSRLHKDRWILTYTFVFVYELIELQGTSGCVYTYRPS